MVSCDFFTKRKNWFYHKWKKPDPIPNQYKPIPPRETAMVLQRYTGRYIRMRKSPTHIPLFTTSISSDILLEYDYVTVNPSPIKAIVFDVDETLGSFSDLFILWNQIRPQDASPTVLNERFIQLALLYPEFIREGIVESLKYIHKKILAGKSHKVYLYTNNQCTYPEWIKLIIHYMDYLVHGNTQSSMFERPICAFKINNRVVDTRRTTPFKTHSDFIRCSLLPKYTEICFIDDTKYAEMIHARVYYIQPPPYYHSLHSTTIHERFIANYPECQHDFIISNGCMNPSVDTYSLEKQQEISSKIIFYIKEFFHISARPHATKKRMIRIGRFTRRHMQLHS